METWLQSLWCIYRLIYFYKYGFYQVFIYLCVNNKKELNYERHKNGHRGGGDY